MYLLLTFDDSVKPLAKMTLDFFVFIGKVIVELFSTRHLIFPLSRITAEKEVCLYMYVFAFP